MESLCHHWALFTLFLESRMFSTNSTLFSVLFIFERETETETECKLGRGREREREGDTESEGGSRLRAISTEPDVGLKLTSREIMT